MVEIPWGLEEDGVAFAFQRKLEALRKGPQEVLPVAPEQLRKLVGLGTVEKVHYLEVVPQRRTEAVALLGD